MTTWNEFAAAAPVVAGVFRSRHAANDELCLLGTLRADGFPRICPLEPRLFEGELVVGGMPGTRKFDDLRRDPRFTLHTATTDRFVSDGDAKLWGRVRDVRDPELHRRFADMLFDRVGLDVRGQPFGFFPVAEILGGSCVRRRDGHLDVTVWRGSGAEETIRKR
ncbi:pyridoxamine 5'-phosphate oxidase family protein [Pseudonocardia sp. HH130630-07]|uniref:pyridoxamine 5'-phosphate oxidase family protein n=1 Tax=Pseudonocardia sp. HH130630-07 TaxID=1690815 RepID=UPI000814CAD3|nr:pyridoxamine 5'-phosphate oxidase family protein [Pseudonocardia sp. HH130630-07]ANY05166.1 pyridoxamine 5-phosphate oxidase [Pseudonocardia sp. HH130630-07]